MIILLRVLWVWICLSLSYAAAEPQCWGAHHADPSWFGFPDYYDCRRLLFGNNDLSGIAAIDDLSHAFVVPETRREFESDSEWESKVELPKFWHNSGCKIALTPTGILNMEGLRRIHRETGQWLPIAETGQRINEMCVRGEGPAGANTGGFDKTGDTGRLIILIFEPGSRIDREIARDLADNRIVTIAAAELFDGNDFDSADEDLDHLQDEFATLLNIGDEVDVHPRADWSDEWGYSHVGKSDPRVKNLGNSWVVAYDSVTSLLPVKLAAMTLSAFYSHIVKIAAGHIGNGTAPTKYLVFVSKAMSVKRLSLTLTSPDPIPWDWIIRFARAMSASLDSSWTVLYKAIARNAYWDVAVINVALSIAAA